MADYAIATITGISIFAYMMLDLGLRYNLQSDRLWVTNLSQVLKHIFFDIGAICSYVALFFMRAIVAVEAPAQTGIIRVLDYLLAGMMYFVGVLFIFSIISSIMTMIDNRMIMNMKKKMEKELDNE